MLKTLQLEIDHASWIAAPPEFQKTCPFLATTSTTVDMLAALLWTGLTASSLEFPQWRFASLWAILRYVTAIDQSSATLALHTGAAELETHAKQVLSDDWGVGIALQWLTTTLQYRSLFHCRPIMEDLERLGLGRLARRGKRGPAKCPDFLAIDAAGKIHVIECKGNQVGGREVRQQQTSGVAQKRSLTFANESLVAQRLVSVVAIAGATTSWTSTLHLTDPPPDNAGPPAGENNEKELTHHVSTPTIAPILGAMRRVSVRQGFALAGALKTAYAGFPQETSKVDLVADAAMETFRVGKHLWRGQRHEIRYPVPIILLDGTPIRASRIRFGVDEELLDQFADNSLRASESVGELPLELHVKSEGISPTQESALPIGRYASIEQGTSLIADFELLE